MLKKILFSFIFIGLLGFEVFALEIGDTLNFGRFYYYPNDNKLYPLEWIVVDKKDNYFLLMTKDIIDEEPFHKYSGKISWEESSIRKWLNNYFYTLAFNETEKRQILFNTVINSEINQLYGTIGDKDTKDRVFILSLNEVLKYFGEYNTLRKAKGTPYAIANGLWVSHLSILSEGYSVWWLRTPGKSKSFNTLVYAAGTPGRAGDPSCIDGNGVRPCIWVKNTDDNR